jgi:hypothetical protein
MSAMDGAAAAMEAFVRLGVSVQRFRNVDLFEKGAYLCCMLSQLA